MAVNDLKAGVRHDPRARVFGFAERTSALSALDASVRIASMHGYILQEKLL